MNKTIKHAIGILMVFFLCIGTVKTVYASDGEEYITISVEAEDNSGTLLYALDTDSPEAFTPSNEFSIPAGTNHTIYVKDSAGNITSQEYISSSEDYEKSYVNEEDESRSVNIDITLDDFPKSEPDYSDHEYAGDLLNDPAEVGQGTVYEKVESSANDPNAERIFYTVTTDEGEVFYLVIDQGQSTNNVYLLDQVNLSDLRALAVDDSGKSESTESSSLLSALSSGNENNGNDELSEEPASSKKSSMGGNLIILLILAAIGGGFYYYKNVYKNKKDEQMDLIDALDREDFEAEDEEDDEVDFGIDDDYQERLMQELMEDDDSVNDAENYFTEEEDFKQELIESESEAEPEATEEKEIVSSYATSHKEEINDEEEYDEDLDSPDEEEE